MTDGVLEGLARQAANIVRTELHLHGCFESILVGISHQGEALYRMHSIERLIRNLAGPHWVENSDAKECLYSTIRIAHASAPAWAPRPGAYILAGTGRARERDGDRITEQHEAVIYALVQTPTRCCIRVEPLDGAAPSTRFHPTSELDGAQIIFRPLTDEERETARHLNRREVT
ncbi:MAG TPA: hypothetical protein VFA33_07665 [Bryobacteraceae bacterium]|nr:hypothetical protein [Bryobacteraceae bacterium]